MNTYKVRTNKAWDKITNCVCGSEVYSQASSSGTQQKDEYVRPETRNSSCRSNSRVQRRFICKLIRHAGGALKGLPMQNTYEYILSFSEFR